MPSRKRPRNSVTRELTPAISINASGTIPASPSTAAIHWNASTSDLSVAEVARQGSWKQKIGSTSIPTTFHSGTDTHRGASVNEMLWDTWPALSHAFPR